MEFEKFTISLLIRRRDAPAMSEVEQAALQDAHMAHLADLYDTGHVLAAGPVLGDSARALRGFSILNVDLDQALDLKEQDPAIRAGWYRVEVHRWILPAGLIAFTRGRLPRSMADTHA